MSVLLAYADHIGNNIANCRLLPLGRKFSAICFPNSRSRPHNVYTTGETALALQAQFEQTSSIDLSEVGLETHNQ
jgi:hypothetical protein